MVENINQNKELDQDIWFLYLYALKSPMTREKYQKRLKFFDFLGSEGTTIEEKSKNFLKRIKVEDHQWAFNSILKFMISVRQSQQ